MLAGRPISCSACLDRLDRLAERGAGRQVERDRRRRELAEMVDLPAAPSAPAPGRSPTAAPGRWRRSRTAGRSSPSELSDLLHFGLGFEDHAVLVRLREDRRDDALPEGIVERIVDRRRGDAEPRGGGAVDQDIGGEAVFREVAGDVLELRHLLQALQQSRHPDRKLGRVGVLAARIGTGRG